MEMLWSLLLLFAVLPSALGQPLPHQRLVQDILEDHDPLVRPVKDPRKSVNITFRLTLYQILDVNEAIQAVSLYCWLIESWHDEFIRWNPDGYNGEKMAVIDAKKVWRPDTYLYNSIDTSGMGHITSAIVEMRQPDYSHAHVRLQYPAILKFSCSLFLLYFPFDKQNCSLEFASWVYDIEGINYYPDAASAHMDHFVPNNEWEIDSFQAVRNVKKYSCCPVPYVSLFYFLSIRRKPLFYVLNLIIPTVIISGIALVGFFFPSHSNGEREEKVSLGISTLLSMSVFLLMVSDELPTASDVVPFIGWFYIGVIVFIAFATMTTSIVLVIQQQGRYGYAIPTKWKDLMFNKVARFIILKPPVSLRSRRRRKRHKISVAISPCDDPTRETLINGPVHDTSTVFAPNRELCQCNGIEENHHTEANEISQQHTIVNTNGDVVETVHYPDIMKINKSVQELIGRYEVDQNKQLLELEWEWFVSILEQALLALFLVFLVCFTAFLMGRGYGSGGQT